jgi:hypothetical protein
LLFDFVPNVPESGHIIVTKARANGGAERNRDVAWRRVETRPVSNM